MLTGGCHCGAVRWRLAHRPADLTRCTCSYCRRSGALWAYGARREITIEADEAALIRYVQGDRTLAFVSCRVCGCTTHWDSLDPSDDARMAVNARMADPIEIEDLPVRVFDGADSWRYVED